MLEANRLILDNLIERHDGKLIDSQVDGRVVIEAGARLERTTVRGPAVIGAGAQLSDCYIGPYTAIGENCSISGAEVEHSILLAGSSVCDLDGRMESSLLGRNVTVRRGDRQPRAGPRARGGSAGRQPRVRARLQLPGGGADGAPGSLPAVVSRARSGITKERRASSEARVSSL